MQPLTIQKLVLKRLVDNWRLMLCIFAGILVATSLVAGAPTYMRALERLGLHSSIERAPDTVLNSHIFSPNIPLTATGLQRSQGVLDGAIERYIAPIYLDQRRFLRSDTYLAGLSATALSPQAGLGGRVGRGYIQYLTDIEHHIRFVDGRMATDAVSVGPEGTVVEVILGTPSLEVFPLHVGDEVVMTPFLAHPTRVIARLVGIFEPTDPTEAYWRHNANIFLRPAPPQEVPETAVQVAPNEPPLPFFTTETAMIEGVGKTFPGSLVYSTWLIFVDRENLKAWSIAEGSDRLTGFERAITDSLPGSAVLSGVQGLFAEHERRSLFTGIPLALLLALMVVTVLYYLLMMVSYLVQSREGDVARLKTRGVGTWQVLKLYAGESVALTAVAVVAAPFIAAGAVALSGKLPYFNDITGGAMLPARVEGLAFLIALGVGFACLAIYVLPGVLGARTGLIVHRLRSSRPPTTPVFQRYYLDLALLALGGMVFWELYTRGNIASGGLFSNVQVNETLLLAPVLFLVAVALVFMRFFPLLVKFASGESAGLLHLVVAATVVVLSAGVGIDQTLDGGGFGWAGPAVLAVAIGGAYWMTQYARKPYLLWLGLAVQAGLVTGYILLEPLQKGEVFYAAKAAVIAIVPGQVLFLGLKAAINRTPVWASMGLWHMARNPLQYSWLVLLLVLVTGLGILATTVGGTLDRSYQDRINYETATDIRVSNIPGNISRGKTALKERYQTIPGVTSVSLALRGGGGTGSTGGGVAFQALAIESEVFPYMAWYREDFSDQLLNVVLRKLQTGPLALPLSIPDNATELGVYVKASDVFSNIFLWMVVEDQRGVVSTITFGPAGPPQWHLLRADLPKRLVPPFRLLSIQLYEPAFGPAGTPGSILIDDIHAVTPDGQATVLEGFEGQVLWTPLSTSELSSNSLDAQVSDVFAGTRSGVFTFGKDTDRGIRGFYYSPSGGPVPVIISTNLSVATGLGAGDTLIVNALGGLMPVVVRDVIDYFPTLDPNVAPFLVVDLEAAIRHLELLAPTFSITPNEMFLSHAPGAEATITDVLWESLGRVQPIRVYGREAQLEAVRLDPLITAGWKAMVIMALGVIVLTAALGYTTYLLSFAGRSRTEMGYLQTLGLSSRQLLGLLGLEHLVIALFGLGLGTWAGFQMSNIMVRSVSVTERGNEVVPPFVVITDWSFMGPIYIILVAIFVVAVWVLHHGVAHLDLHTLARGEAV